jgi:hypothetical protein
MKKYVSITAFLVFGFAAASQAQDTVKVKDTENLGNKIEQGAKDVGNKTAEIASKGKAKVTDEVYKDAVGPNNEKVYIDNHSKYYWIDKKGHRHYAEKSELKAKEQ